MAIRPLPSVSLLGVVLASAACAEGATATGPILDAPDADLVLVFPAADEDALGERWAALWPWIEARSDAGLSVATLPLYDVAGDTAEDIRLHLAEHFTGRRAGDDEQGRYLGLVGGPDDVPRFTLALDGVDLEVPTDIPYGFPGAEVALDDGATTAFGDFDLAEPTFLVFRIPADEPDDLAAFADRVLRFEGMDSRRDATLVAGSISTLAGATAILQCQVADALAELPGAGQVFKVFDADYCEPDLVVEADDRRLPHFLAETDAWKGGVIYNISHGSGRGIQYLAPSGHWTYNLSLDDEDLLDDGKLNVFLSLSCAADEDVGDRLNLTRTVFEHGSVAVVTSTVPTYFDPGLEDVLEIEVRALPAVLGSDGTLLQAIQPVRDGYLAAAADYAEDERIFAWSNLLGLNVTGDGTVRVGP